MPARVIVEQGPGGPLQPAGELTDTSQPGGGWWMNADPSASPGNHLAIGDAWHHIRTPPSGGGGGGGGGVNTLFGARAGAGPGGIQSINYSVDLPRVSNSFSQLATPRLSSERIYTGTGTQFPGFGAIPNTTSLTTLVSNVADVTATADGSLDAQYEALFAGLTKQCFFSPLVQEPDTGTKNISAAQAKAAVDRVADIAADFPLVSVGVILTSFQIHQQGVPAMKAWCSTKADWVGVDCYGNYGIPALKDMPTALKVGNTLAVAMGQPMIVPEMSFGGGSGFGGSGFTVAQIEADVPTCIAYLKSIASPCCTWFESNKMPIGVSGADGAWCLALADGALQSYPTATTAWQLANDASIAAYVAP